MRTKPRLTVRLNLVLAAIVVLVGVNATLAVRTARSRDQARSVALTLRDANVEVKAIAQAVVDEQTAERGFLITGDEDYLRRDGDLAVVGTQPTLAGIAAGDPELREAAAAVDRAIEAWRQDAQAVEIAAYRRGGPAAAAEVVASGRGRVLFDEVRSRIDALLAVVTDRQEDSSARVQDTYDRFLRLVFVTLGAVVLTALVVGRLLLRWITRPVQQLARSVEAVRAGDLDRAVVVAGPPELEEIGTAVENMRARLVAEIARAEQATAEVAVANAELEAFSYSVSHDLRSPLRAIDGFGQALLEDAGPRLDESSRGHLARIRAATGRMAELIDDLLELSRVSRVAAVPTEVNVSDMAQQLVARLRDVEPQRCVDVSIQPGLKASADASLLRIVLENLLGNAWKFTSNAPEAHIELVGYGPAPRTVFTISDNGAGFDQAYADKLFTPFQRLHHEREFPGTGIGLATVARIVHRHGGQVSATGAVGRGAAVSFTLSPERHGGANGSR